MTPSRIVGLQIENFMRVSAVDLSPNGEPLIQITGKNAEGKSSVLNAIWAALQWRDAAGSIKEPIRRGEEKATVRIDLGDLIVSRTWKGDKTALQVTTRDGAKYSSPQSILDKLVSEIGFDPLEFTRMQPKDQRQTLMNLLKIDFSQYDEERADLLREKSVTSAHISGLQQQYNETSTVPEDIPDHEVSASDLIQQIQTAQTVINQHQAYLKDLATASQSFDLASNKVHRLEAELQEARDDLKRHDTKIQTLNTLISTAHLPDIAPLQDNLSNIEQTNKQVRQKQQKKALLEKLQQAEQTLTDLTESIADIDQDKRDCLESAKFPVTGLSFDETGVLLNGVPFSQASTAEQIRVSLAIGITLNPNLRVMIIKDGNALDSSSLGIVSKMAKDEDMQIWMERVDESGLIGICIEDGMVKTAPGQQEIS